MSASAFSKSSERSLSARTAGRQQAPPTQVSDTGSADDKSRKKFLGKSPEEVLEPLGWPKIVKDYNDCMALVDNPSMNTFLRGSEVDAFNDANNKLKKDIGSTHKALVALDIKVRKWLNVPEVRILLACQVARTWFRKKRSKRL